jgi:biopolymer transport protein ExbB
VNPISTTIGLILATTPSPDASPAAEASAMQVQSVWDFIVKGGPMMVPIAICSLIGLAVLTERLLTLRRSKVIPPDFMPGLHDVLEKHPGDQKKALAYCDNDQSPLARVFAAGVKRLGAPLEVLEKQIQEAGQREVLKLRRFVRALSVIAAITPLMGLLGTIFGMIKAFQTVAMSADSLGRAELLAEGIYEAMITTAAGLTVAIPVLIGYHWISSTIERLVMEIDLMTVDFLDKHAPDHAPAAKTAVAATTATAAKPAPVKAKPTAASAAPSVMAPAAPAKAKPTAAPAAPATAAPAAPTRAQPAAPATPNTAAPVKANAKAKATPAEATNPATGDTTGTPAKPATPDQRGAA